MRATKEIMPLAVSGWTAASLVIAKPHLDTEEKVASMMSPALFNSIRFVLRPGAHSAIVAVTAIETSLRPSLLGRRGL